MFLSTEEIRNCKPNNLKNNPYYILNQYTSRKQKCKKSDCIKYMDHNDKTVEKEKKINSKNTASFALEKICLKKIL